MPAFITHYLFALDCKEEIQRFSDFEIDFDSLSLGSQGPDIFFFANPLSVRPMRKLGSTLHRTKPELIFDALAEYLKLSSSNIANSYAYGFILHYALDRKCHPYVYAKQEEILKSNHFIHHSSAHNKVEMSLDAYMLHKKLKIERPSKFDTAATITLNYGALNEIGELMSFVIKSVTEQSVSSKKIIGAIKSTKRMQTLLRDKTGLLKLVCIIIESISAPFIKFFKFSSMIRPSSWKGTEKYANINNEEWRSPFDTESESRLSFEQLYDEAKSEAYELIFGLEQIKNSLSNGKAVTKNISFLTGREVLQ